MTAEERLPLVPLDEAYLAHAHTLADIAEAVLRDFPLEVRRRAGEPGDELRNAGYLQSLVETLIRHAVVVERERGASWADIGEAAGTSRQAAHEKWAAMVEGWTTISHRRRSGIDAGTRAELVTENLDAWYGEIDPERPHALADGLASLHDEDARRTAEEQRTAAIRLRAELERQCAEERRASDAAILAVGTPEVRAAGAAWAQVHLTKAGLYNQLADAEAPLAAEHRRQAGIQRGRAQDLLRDFPPTKENDR